MKILVYSRNQLNEIEKNKIKGIFKESKCPNESLKNTFNRFAFMQGNNTVYFDDITMQNRNEAIITELDA